MERWLLCVCLIVAMGYGSLLKTERVMVNSEAPDSELFSSILELEKVKELQGEIQGFLREYVTSTEKKINLIKQYLLDSEAESSLTTSTDSLKHPLNAYVLIRNLVINWEPMRRMISRDNDTDFEVIRRKLTKFPTDDDLFGAAKSLILLQETYNMNLEYMARGVIHLQNEVTYPAESALTAQDLLYLGKHAFNAGLYNMAVEMLQIALNRSRSGEDDSVSPGDVEPFLKTSIKFHDIALQRKGPLGKDWRTNPVPYNKDLLKTKKFANKSKTLTTSIPLYKENLKEFQKMELYHQLCRGEELNRHNHQLVCRLVDHNDPYLRIGPFKIEEHHLAPYIVTFKGIISDGEAELIKTVVADRLFRSKTGRENNHLTSHIRTSKQSWLSEDEHPVVAMVTRRIERATRLLALPEEIGAERYQVANYGVGGRYSVHVDTLEMQQSMTPARLATFMSYLNDVEAGGSTVFPLLGVSINPKKGDAAFWFNLKSSLEVDRLTLHGGCPVLVGSKWILNKWFLNFHQVSSYPCLRDRNGRFRF